MSVKKHAQSVHADLAAILEAVYGAHGLVVTQLVQELESREYGAASFMLNGMQILFRAAHITPTKVGQFVTLWKRSGGGPIQPYDDTDVIDFVVISVRSLSITHIFGM